MEKAWPPLSECVQFKIGLMHEALFKYPWEDDEYAFDFDSYYPPIPEELASLRKLLDTLNKEEFRSYDFQRRLQEDCRDCPFCRLHPDPLPLDIPTAPGYETVHIPLDVGMLKDPVWDMDPIPCPFHLLRHVWPLYTPRPWLVTPIELEDTKKYLNQVRNSRGYDVDCLPSGALVTTEFWEEDPNYSGDNGKMKDVMKQQLDSTAIVHINDKTGKDYELVDILKIVRTRRPVFLFTFTAKVKNDDSAPCETFIATILLSSGIVEECLLHPGCDAPGPDHYPDFTIHPIQVPNISMWRRIAAARFTKNRSHWLQENLHNDSFLVHGPRVFSQESGRCPPDVEENREEGGGSSVHVEETSPNPDSEDIPSPLI